MAGMRNTVGLVYDDVDAASSMRPLGPIAVLPDEGGRFFAHMRYRGANITLNRPGWDSDPRPPRRTTPSSSACTSTDGRQLRRWSPRHAGVAAAQTPWERLRARVRDPSGYLWDLARRNDSRA